MENFKETSLSREESSESLNFKPRQVVVREVIEINGERHLVEVTYEEKSQDLWQKVAGSEKDLGRINIPGKYPSREEIEGAMSDDLPPEERKIITITRVVEKNDGKKHLVEITYEGIRPNSLKKIHGSEKDLGEILEENSK